MPPKTATKAATTTKGPAKTTGQAATKKDTTAKAPSKAEPKKAQSKSTAKAPTKTTTTKGTTEKKPPRKNLNQSVGFVYAGDIIKGSNVYLFHSDSANPTEHVRETLVPYFGANVNGRFVKCEDAEETFNAVLAAAEEKEYKSALDCKNILKCNVGDAADLIKTAAGASIAHVIKLTEPEDKPDKAKATTKGAAKGAATKGGKAKKDAEEEDEAADEADNDDGDEVSDEAEADADDEGEAESDDEEAEAESEDEPEPPKKVVQKGGAKGGAVQKGGKQPAQKATAKKNGK